MQFLVDAQLPPALARLLREHGHTAEHITEIGPADAPDSEIWRYALEHDAVIVTKDEDFADMVAPPVGRHLRSSGSAPATPAGQCCWPFSSRSSSRSSRWWVRGSASSSSARSVGPSGSVTPEPVARALEGPRSPQKVRRKSATHRKLCETTTTVDQRFRRSEHIWPHDAQP